MRLIVLLLLVAFLISGSFTPVSAADEAILTRKDITGVQVPVSPAEADKKDAEDSFLKGVHFGAGIMANMFTGGKKPVETARVVGGVVRVEEESKGQVGAVLEFHTLWTLCKTENLIESYKKRELKMPLYSCGEDVAQFGIGPSLGVKLGSNNVIDAIFLGPLFAFRPNKNSKNSFNLAIGGIMAPRVKVLGDGIEEGQALPAGETEVRYKKVTKFGYSVLLSFAF